MLSVTPVVVWSFSLASDTKMSQSRYDGLRRYEGKRRPPPGTSKRWYSLAGGRAAFVFTSSTRRPAPVISGTSQPAWYMYSSSGVSVA